MIIFIGGLFAVNTMSLYDNAILKQLDVKISKTRLLKNSFIVNTLNNFIGLGGVAGVGLRTWLYREESIDNKKLVFYIVMIVPTALTGLSLLTFIPAFNFGCIELLFKQHPWLWLGLILAVLYIPVYFLLYRLNWFRKKIPSEVDSKSLFNFKMELIIASVVEWFFAGLFFWIVAYCFNSSLYFLQTFSIFTIAAIAGVISLTPGGLGSFDLLSVFGLQMNGIDLQKAFAILLIYRLFYYIIPMFIGGIMVLFGNQDI